MSPHRAPWIVGLVLLGGLLPPAATVAQAETCSGQPVLMLTRGERPWRELRYAWVAGTTEAVTISALAEIATTSDGAPESAIDIGMAMDLEETVVDVAEDGAARMELLIRDAHVRMDATMIDGEPVSEDDRATLTRAMEDVSRAMVGLTGWEVRDARGDVRSFAFDLPDGAPDTLREQFEQSMTPPLCLPSQPVGVGATWASSLRAAGVGSTIRVVTAIESIDGDLVTLTQSMTFDMDDALRDQLSELDGVVITGMESYGEGHARQVVDLGHIYPVSEMELDVGYTMDLDSDGTPIATTMDMRMTSEVGPEASPSLG